MLFRSAVKVYALDVGYGQLDYKLRVDSRVINMEKTNIRYLDMNLIAKPIDFISIDVSFISLRHMFPVASALRMAAILLEAEKRTLWQAQPETKEALTQLYMEMEGELEERAEG